MKILEKYLKKQIIKEIEYNYLLILPDDYENKDKWPLIIYLHGRCDRGNDLNILYNNGIPKIIKNGLKLPFIILAPQCKNTSFWGLEIDNLNGLIQEIIVKEKIDKNRVFVTGFSMGGYAAWMLADNNPNSIKGIIPVCGGVPDEAGYPERLNKLKEKSIWIFHGLKDDIVPIKEANLIIDYYDSIGKKINITIYNDKDHNIWDETYKNEELYKWMLEQ